MLTPFSLDAERLTRRIFICYGANPVSIRQLLWLRRKIQLSKSICNHVIYPMILTVNHVLHPMIGNVT